MNRQRGDHRRRLSRQSRLAELFRQTIRKFCDGNECLLVRSTVRKYVCLVARMVNHRFIKRNPIHNPEVLRRVTLRPYRVSGLVELYRRCPRTGARECHVRHDVLRVEVAGKVNEVGLALYPNVWSISRFFRIGQSHLQVGVSV